MKNVDYKKILKAAGVFLTLFLVGCGKDATGILNPKGVIAYEEKILLFDSIALMLIVVLPVIIMSFAFVYRYRESHKTAEYKPNWSHSVFLEGLWWGIPCVIIVAMGIMSWKATHKLDPYRKIDGHDVAMHVQVVALPWKWLFIYPEQNVASVNELVLPEGKQTEFSLTTDNVPMSAFFIPQLGSQIYTMAGMRTKLHLLPTAEGTFRGLNAQYNGDGFSDMHFPVRVVNEKDLNAWFKKVKASGRTLDAEQFAKLRQNSINSPAEYFSGVKPKLFQEIIMSYMQPPASAKPITNHSN